jgi:hypothetical protein
MVPRFSRECLRLRCHKIMTLTAISAHPTLPNVDLVQLDCACGHLIAPVCAGSPASSLRSFAQEPLRWAKRPVAVLSPTLMGSGPMAP